jgi:hypothetical protein
MLQAIEISKQLVSIFKIKRSSLLVSFRGDSQNKLRLVEVHLDLGGDLLIEEVFPRSLPFDFIELALFMSVGINKVPNNFLIKPTAIFYKKGSGLITDREFKVLSASSNKMLEKQILESNI